MKMKQKILNNMVYIAVVAVLITTTLIGMFTYYRYMEQIKTGMKDDRNDIFHLSYDRLGLPAHPKNRSIF